MYYDLSKSFPMITTKKVFLRGIFAELIFNLNGFTDNTILQNQGINIWTGNTTREFLDKSNLQHLDENDLGQTYGFNMRHYSETYINCKTKYINLKELFFNYFTPFANSVSITHTKVTITAYRFKIIYI